MARKSTSKSEPVWGYTMIGEVEKTASTIIRVGHTTMTDDEGTKDYIDIREWFKKKTDTDYSRSAKGLMIPLEKADDLLVIFEDLQNYVQELSEKPKKRKATKKPATKKKTKA